jgi:hypothetical protein
MIGKKMMIAWMGDRTVERRCARPGARIEAFAEIGFAISLCYKEA